MPSTRWSKYSVIFFLRLLQGAVHALALDGVADRTLQPAGGKLVLDEVILGARMHRLDGDGFVVGFAGDDDGQPGGLRPDEKNVGQTRPVGNGDIAHHDIKAIATQGLDSGSQIHRRRKVGRQIARRPDHLAESLDEARIMLNQQNF